MRNTTIVLLIAFLLLIAGCVRSLHQLYTDKDLVFEEKLLGTWSKEGENKDTWVFQKAGENAYDLIVTEKGAPAKFEAHLVKLGKFHFLDIAPSDLDTKNDFYKFHHLPVHTFSRIWLERNQFRLALLDNDWLKDMIDQKKIDIKHEREDKAILLTAATEDLQKLVTTYAENPQAFPNPAKFLRQK